MLELEASLVADPLEVENSDVAMVLEDEVDTALLAERLLLLATGLELIVAFKVALYTTLVVEFRIGDAKEELELDVRLYLEKVGRGWCE